MTTSRAFWDKIAAKYDRKTVKGPNYQARIERAATWVGPEARVLDAGCAGGQITLDLAPHVASILGVDISEKLIGFAEARRQEAGAENASFDAVPIEDATLGAGSFDAITAYSLLHLVDDAPATLRRFHELLRPGGVLILELPCRESINVFFRWMIKVMTAVGKAPVVTIYPLAEWEAMIRDAGFTIEEVKVYNPKSLSHSVLCRKEGT